MRRNLSHPVFAVRRNQATVEQVRAMFLCSFGSQNAWYQGTLMTLVQLRDS